MSFTLTSGETFAEARHQSALPSSALARRWQLADDLAAPAMTWQQARGLATRKTGHQLHDTVSLMANDGDAADVAAVAACLRDAMQRKDVAVLLSLMTDDIVIVPPLGPPVVGLDAVRAALTNEPRLHWFKFDFDVGHAFGDSTVEVLGDVAIVTSNDSIVVTPRGNTFPTFGMCGRVISVFRRRVDGWRLARSVNLMAKVRTPA